jgi:tetratricopeptide (TPR) repeat protein
MQRGLFLLFVAIAALGDALLLQTVAAQEQRRAPILIPGVEEPDEMRVEPLPSQHAELTAAERELAEATNNFSKINLVELLPVLDRILAKYPEFADGYVFRLGVFCENGDRLRAASDVNSALKFMGTSRTMKETLGAFLSTRAKLAYTDGDYLGAMDGLEKAIRADLKNATQFTNSGAVKPEKTASVCVWTERDMGALVRRFPGDYRSHMFRGLYFSKFAPLDDDSLKPAIESFDRAAQLNAKSAPPQMFKAELLANPFVFYKRLNQLGWGDAARDRLNTELVGEYTKALALDANLLPALNGRAAAFFNLKQYQKAIGDYDKVLQLDPPDAITYNDRGLAKSQLGLDLNAIGDFSSALKLKKRELLKSSSYEGRADVYIKTRQWNLAIRDLTTAISLQVGGSVLLMGADQFRAIYPEYRSAADQAIARKLQQTFFPDLKYEEFAKSFANRPSMPSTVIPDLYLKRADVYLKAGNWRRASLEFRRATNGFPEYGNAAERWGKVGEGGDVRTYIDLRTYDDTRKDAIKLWIKQSRGRAKGPARMRCCNLS